MTTLPHIAGLDWTPDGPTFTAAATPEFWDHYFTPSRSRLAAIGVTVKKTAVWNVHFDPAVTTLEAVTAIATALREEAFAAEMIASELRVAAEHRQRELQVIRDASNAEREVKRRADQDEAQARARKCWDTWGLACANKVKMVRWINDPRLMQWEIEALNGAVRETEWKAERRKLEAANAPDSGVDWPDWVVEAAVRFLTSLDQDHSKERNFKGWSAGHSSSGHWCCAMLDIDRDLALRASRLIVGEYQDTQLTFILDDWRNSGEAA